MEKDFETWSRLKRGLNDREHQPYVHPREIWTCSVGANVGVETDGKNENFARPVLVFKVFSREMFWGIPITSKPHVGKFFYAFKFQGNDSVAVLSQMRVLSPKRLVRKWGVLPEAEFARLRDQLLRLI